MALLADTALCGSSRDMAPSADSLEGRLEATVGSSEKALASREGQGLEAWKCVLRPWYGLQVCMKQRRGSHVTDGGGHGGASGHLCVVLCFHCTMCTKKHRVLEVKCDVATICSSNERDLADPNPPPPVQGLSGAEAGNANRSLLGAWSGRIRAASLHCWAWKKRTGADWKLGRHSSDAV